MRIAIIGWGSLIWCPGSLQIRTGWFSNGPILPIEFARISGDGRLTLVINPGSPEVRTYWAVSDLTHSKEARVNLAQREGTTLAQIHSVDTNVEDPAAGSASGLNTAIRSWLKSQQNLDAAVWTGLGSNWKDRRGRDFSAEDAVGYLSELERQRDEAAARYDRACEYIRNTPEQIQTSVRAMLRDKRDFKDATLATSLFEKALNEAGS
jgi:hypothetical protein